MARVFTVSFDFEGISYDALVVARGIEGGTTYDVHVFDEGIYHLLPDGNICFTTHEKSEAPNGWKRGSVEDLILKIKESISMHLKY